MAACTSPVFSVQKWIKKNYDEGNFAPPIMNKLMYKGEELQVMFVGGPNVRKDFHIQEGEEFFWQLKGNMWLDHYYQGDHRVTNIREGQVFMQPSRIAHGPRRPEEGSVGFVLERAHPPYEKDGLLWFCEDEKGNYTDELLFEQWFHCENLGKDLRRVCGEYNDFVKAGSNGGRPILGKTVLADDKQRPIDPLLSLAPHQPFFFNQWIEQNETMLEQGACLDLFKGKHRGEYSVLVSGVRSEKRCWSGETLLWQIKGGVSVSFPGNGNNPLELLQDDLVVIHSGVEIQLDRKEGSFGLIITTDRTKCCRFRSRI